ncbi:MAG: hypothetical protein ACFE89_12795 [Candidatus Hodarchaeota archaeon]
MTDRLDTIFRIWILLLPVGILLLATSIAHFTFRVLSPALFLLPNDPAAWLMLATGVLLVLAGSSRGFKERVKRLVREILAWIQGRRSAVKG